LALDPLYIEQHYRWADVHRLVVDESTPSPEEQRVSGNIVSLVNAQANAYCERVRGLHWMDGYVPKSIIHHVENFLNFFCSE
jgi:hypothetical protein